VFAADKYNGKELDTEDNLHLYDYGARRYDAALCRWNAMDALAEKYYNVSPYNYCVGNPIMFVDPDGNSIDWVEGKEGSVYWNENAIALS
jgi:RHS repeat-associated protein